MQVLGLFRCPNLRSCGVRPISARHILFKILDSTRSTKKSQPLRVPTRTEYSFFSSITSTMWVIGSSLIGKEKHLRWAKSSGMRTFPSVINILPTYTSALGGRLTLNVISIPESQPITRSPCSSLINVSRAFLGIWYLLRSSLIQNGWLRSFMIETVIIRFRVILNGDSPISDACLVLNVNSHRVTWKQSSMLTYQLRLGSSN